MILGFLLTINSDMNKIIIGDATLYCGNCLDILPEITNIDLVCCDPPYGTTLMEWDTIIDYSTLWPLLRKSCSKRYIMTASQPFTSALVMSNTKQFSHELIWSKSKTGNPFLAKIMPMKTHENILVFGKGPYNPIMTPGEPYTRMVRSANKNNTTNNHKYGVKDDHLIENKGERYPKSVQHFTQNWSRQQQIHPTQKPVELMKWLIETYSNPNDTILDFSMGSGTTGIAAIQAGRKFVGIEISDVYFKIAQDRIQEAVNAIVPTIP